MSDRERVTLLEECRAGIDRYEARALAVRPLLPVLGWSTLLLAVGLAGASGPAGSGATTGWLALLVSAWWLCAWLVPGPRWAGHVAGAVVLVVLGAATLPLVEEAGSDALALLLGTGWVVALGGSVLYGVRWAREVRRDVAAARAAYSRRREPQWRGDGAPQADPEVATVFDLRERDDFDDRVGLLVARANAGLYSLRAAGPPVVLTVTGVLGLVLALVPLTGIGVRPWEWATTASGVALMGLYTWAMVGATLGVLWQRQTEANRVVVEAWVYGNQRSLERSLAAPRRARLGIGGAAGATLGVLWLGILAARLRTSSVISVLVALGIVALVAAAVVVWASRRRRGIHVFPLDGDGPGLLQAPGREVTLHETEAGLEIAAVRPGPQPVRLGHDEVVGVVDVTAAHPFAGGGVALLTRGAPVVLVGGGVADLPSVRRLRGRTPATD